MKRCCVCHQDLPFEDCVKLKGKGGRPVFKCNGCLDKFPDLSRGEAGKKCTHCGITKTAGEFGLRRDGRNGRKAYCRECQAARRRAHRMVQYNPGTKEERAKSGSAVFKAIREGLLTRGPCAECGTTARVHGHHPDYSRPTEVVWLCSKHHAEEHARLRRDYPPKYTLPQLVP